MAWKFIGFIDCVKCEDGGIVHVDTQDSLDAIDGICVGDSCRCLQCGYESKLVSDNIGIWMDDKDDPYIYDKKAEEHYHNFLDSLSRELEKD